MCDSAADAGAVAPEALAPAAELLAAPMLGEKKPPGEPTNDIGVPIVGEPIA